MAYEMESQNPEYRPLLKIIRYFLLCAEKSLCSLLYNSSLVNPLK